LGRGLATWGDSMLAWDWTVLAGMGLDCTGWHGTGLYWPAFISLEARNAQVSFFIPY
jgi:hypothetical protein